MNSPTNYPIAYQVEKAAEAAGIGRTALYAAIKSGQLVAKKYGRRTLIAAADLKAFLDSLPTIKPTVGDNRSAHFASHQQREASK